VSTMSLALLQLQWDSPMSVTDGTVPCLSLMGVTFEMLKDCDCGSDFHFAVRTWIDIIEHIVLKFYIGHACFHGGEEKLVQILVEEERKNQECVRVLAQHRHNNNLIMFCNCFQLQLSQIFGVNVFCVI